MRFVRRGSNGHFSHTSTESRDASAPRRNLARSRPVSPYSPKPLATAIVSPLAVLPRPLRRPDRSEKPATELVGIARLAASSPCAEAKRGTEYFLLPVKLDPERVPFGAGAVPLDGEPVPRMRIWLQVLLCALHARVHGARRRRIRNQDLCEAGRRAACRTRPRMRADLGRAHRHRNRDRSLPASGEGIWRHARDSGADGRARGAQPFHHDEVESGAARYRPAAGASRRNRL